MNHIHSPKIIKTTMFKTFLHFFYSFSFWRSFCDETKAYVVMWYFWNFVNRNWEISIDVVQHIQKHMLLNTCIHNAPRFFEWYSHQWLISFLCPSCIATFLVKILIKIFFYRPHLSRMYSNPFSLLSGTFSNILSLEINFHKNMEKTLANNGNIVVFFRIFSQW